MKFTKPNFNNCILNISASFAEFLGAENKNKTNKIINKALKNNYKNIVFIIFDGMGIHPIKTNLDKNSFIRKNIKDKITSVFPSTTTNATTTLLTNKTPLEHGWLGWSMYFEELLHPVDIYMAKNSLTKEAVDPNFVKNTLPIEPYYKNAKTNYVVSKVVPPYWQDGIAENRYTFTDIDVMFKHISAICNSSGNQFIYCYCPEPDSTMHEFGVSSKEAHEIINYINHKLEEFANGSSNTLIVVTADHGQTDVAGNIDLFKDQKLYQMLQHAPSLEPRATAFKVKPEKREEFEKHFKNTYGKDFKLYKTSTLVKKNYFGKNITPNTRFLGDYIAVCKNNKMFYFLDEEHFFKGHHTSLGKEMWVPLIVYNCE